MSTSHHSASPASGESGASRNAAASPLLLTRTGQVSLLQQMLRSKEPAFAKVAEGSCAYDPSCARTLYLHVGFPKTASSSIQHTLAMIGARDQWRYVHAGLINSSVPIEVAFLSQPEACASVRGDSTDLGVAKAWVLRELDAALRRPANTYILSAESISWMHASECERLLQWLRVRVDRLVVVQYVRTLRSYIESFVQQHARGRNFDAFADRALMDSYPHYRRRLEKFDQLLAPGDVLLRRFDRTHLVGGDAVIDFAHTVGIHLDPNEVHIRNQSLTLDGLRVLLALVAYGQASGWPMDKLAKRHRRMQSLLRTMGGEKMALSNRLIDELAAEQANDMAWAQSRVGADWPLHRRAEADAPGAVTDLADLQQLPPSAPTLAWVNAMLMSLGKPRLPQDCPSPDLRRALHRVFDNMPSLKPVVNAPAPPLE